MSREGITANAALWSCARFNPRSTWSSRLPQPLQDVTDHGEENVALHVVVVHQID